MSTLKDLNTILPKDINEFVHLKDKYDKDYTYALARLKRADTLTAFQHSFQKELKQLYIIKRASDKLTYSYLGITSKEIQKQIDKVVKALTIIAYVKRRDWNNVGVCGCCVGKGLISYYDYCDCTYELLSGWNLKYDLRSKDYKYKLVNMDVLIKELKCKEDK